MKNSGKNTIRLDKSDLSNEILHSMISSFKIENITIADMGHPAPFNLKMVGVGNEQWGTQYIDRLKIFLKVLNEKHPEISFVGGSGPFPGSRSRAKV